MRKKSGESNHHLKKEGQKITFINCIKTLPHWHNLKKLGWEDVYDVGSTIQRLSKTPLQKLRILLEWCWSF